MSSSGPMLVTMSRSNGSHIYIYNPGTEVWRAGGWQRHTPVIDTILLMTLLYLQ